jgi:hypothetical protein
MPGVRWLAVIAVCTLAVGCTFDPGGTARGDDVADAATMVDGSSIGVIDAPPSLPIDGAPSSPIDAEPTDSSCSVPSDCPGALCCSYAGGWATSCSDSCVGGEQVCEHMSDCSGNDRCCERWNGPNTCGWCLQ